MRGWWILTISGVDTLNDVDREHISNLIQQGFTSGEVVQEDEQLLGEASTGGALKKAKGECMRGKVSGGVEG